MSSEGEVQKNKANRNNRSEGYKKMSRLAGVAGLISIIMLFFYFWRFNDGLSYDSNNWSAFGSYFGSITGLLAFAGVLISSYLSEKRADEAEARLDQQEEESRKRYVEDSERAIFFQLLELHNNKLESVVYEVNIINFSNNNKVNNINNSGSKAFKNYVEEVNILIARYIVLKDTLIYNSKMDLYNSYGNNKKTLKKIYNDIYGTKKYSVIKEENINLLKDFCIEQSIDNNTNYVQWALLKCKRLNNEEMYEAIKNSYDLIYRDYGHILGHYFRNMYYILDTIDSFRGDDDYKQKYAKLFRAQLSRFEIALIICNAVSSQSTEKVITLLQKYEILNGFYNQDLFCTKDIPNNTINNSQKDKGKILINDILIEANKQYSKGK